MVKAIDLAGARACGQHEAQKGRALGRGKQIVWQRAVKGQQQPGGKVGGVGGGRGGRQR
jgi:hypothetical protein